MKKYYQKYKSVLIAHKPKIKMGLYALLALTLCYSIGLGIYKVSAHYINLVEGKAKIEAEYKDYATKAGESRSTMVATIKKCNKFLNLFLIVLMNNAITTIMISHRLFPISQY